MGDCRVCHTLHNVKHQGVAGEDVLWLTGLGRPEHFCSRERMGDDFNPNAINFTKGAIVFPTSSPPSRRAMLGKCVIPSGASASVTPSTSTRTSSAGCSMVSTTTCGTRRPTGPFRATTRRRASPPRPTIPAPCASANGCATPTSRSWPTWAASTRRRGCISSATRSSAAWKGRPVRALGLQPRTRHQRPLLGAQARTSTTTRIATSRSATTRIWRI